MPKTRKATPADYVIHYFGGARPLARDLGVDEALPSHWRTRRDKRGNLGLIPQAHHKRIIEIAAKRRLPVTAEHLVHGGELPIEPERAAG